MENETLLIWLERKHLLMIMLYLIAWSAVADKVLLFQEKQTILWKPWSTEDYNHNIPTDICQTPATDSNIYLVDQVKNHRHQNGKLEFLIKWLRYSNCLNTWEAENHFSPALVQEYFQQSEL